MKPSTILIIGVIVVVSLLLALLYGIHIGAFYLILMSYGVLHPADALLIAVTPSVTLLAIKLWWDFWFKKIKEVYIIHKKGAA